MPESEVNVMPYKPKIPCKYSGCPELVPSGAMYCKKHCIQLGIPYTGKRPGSSYRGYNNRWRKVRADYLRRNPICVKCLKNGRYTIATVVDHIIPHRGDPVLMWDENNYQALCKSCHDHKTMTEDENPQYHY